MKKAIGYICILLLSVAAGTLIGTFIAENTEEVTIVTTTGSTCEEATEKTTEKPKPAPAKKKEIDKNSVYYGKKYSDVWCETESEDKAVRILSMIDFVEYGTAGCSLQMCSAGYHFIQLAQLDDSDWSEIPAFLDTLNPAQLDFLSFRIVDAYEYAIRIIDRESIVSDLESINIKQEDYKDCTKTQAVRFLCYMFSLFEERGVEYEWEEYDFMTIFR